MPFYNGSELYAFRYKNYKLHLKTSSRFNKVETHDPPMLFDLEIDPSEKYNIAENNPEKVKEILKIINLHKEKIIFGEDQLKFRD
jgi:arylsulfatase A-like enzyme